MSEPDRQKRPSWFDALAKGLAVVVVVWGAATAHSKLVHRVEMLETRVGVCEQEQERLREELVAQEKARRALARVMPDLVTSLQEGGAVTGYTFENQVEKAMCDAMGYTWDIGTKSCTPSPSPSP